MAALMRIGTALLFAGLLCGVSGCTNPFEPAKPPSGSGTGVVEDFATPKKLLDTIADAMAAKGDGASAYSDAFADSTTATDHAYYAFHYPGVVDAYRASAGHDPDVWTKTLERQFFSYLAGNVLPTFTFTMLWAEDPNSPKPVIDEVAGTALYHIYYQVVAAPPSGTAGEQHNILIGYADLYLYKANSRWFIYRWQDRIDPATGVNPSDQFELSWGARRLESL